ncbi:hypothetical protein [Catenulispora rubra]|uniref:hypothetical protein n=1 Tax=Catenulispora rubra TaxID=280293 RepID=UPI001891F3EF|nr:hypothetical protein [Catenulispora rubra]
MTASSQQSPELTVESQSEQAIGTVRGQARILVRPGEHEAATTLRLRRYLPRLSLLRYRDLAQDGSALGPERDAATLPNDDPRITECVVDVPPGAATREYRLEWELNPDDHPAIGVSGEELLLFRAYLVDRGEDGADGAEEIREQRLIRIRWAPPSDAFDRWCTSASTPEPLREALQALLLAEVQTPRICELCHARDDLDLLLAQDRVWECSAEPELEEIRRLFVLRELTGHSMRTFAGTLRTKHHHEDLSAQLAAARERQKARLIAYAPSGTEELPAG